MLGWVSLGLGWLAGESEEIQAGGPGKGTDTAWWDLATLMEQHAACAEDMHLASFDLDKAFDRINRRVLDKVLEQNGFPERLRRPYMAFMGSLKVRLSVAGHLGPARPRDGGIPQGCPWSMAFMALLTTGWVAAVKEKKIF